MPDFRARMPTTLLSVFVMPKGTDLPAIDKAFRSLSTTSSSPHTVPPKRRPHQSSERTAKKGNSTPRGGAVPASEPIAVPEGFEDYTPAMIEAINPILLLDQKMNERRAIYRAFTDSIGALPPIERADAWMRFVAADPDGFGDEEALVYLRSRGVSCTPEIETTIARWRSAERWAIERAASSVPVFNTSTGTVTKVGGMSIEDASRVSEHFDWVLPDFWARGHPTDPTIDFTMLRTVEWCDIGGFDEWWTRMSKAHYEAVLHGGSDPRMTIWWLFSGVRSTLARRLMRRTLERMLEAVEFQSGKDDPWQLYHYGEPVPTQFTFIPWASTVMFANAMLRVADDNASLVTRAGETLIRHQRPDGSWPSWTRNDDESSIVATAMAVHALAYSDARGSARAVAAGCAWLTNAQTEEGCWREHQVPDVVYLSVLVLDALALGRGDPSVTFRDPSQPVGRLGSRASVPSPPQRRFRVALSFPGEMRTQVKTIADRLGQQIGMLSVFYDDNFKSELARPNLDTHLQHIYHEDSDLLVVFLCGPYAKKEWCGVEWRAIRDIIKQRRDDAVMLVRGDDARVPGIYSIDGYVDLRQHSEDEVAQLILDRLASLGG